MGVKHSLASEIEELETELMERVNRAYAMTIPPQEHEVVAPPHYMLSMLPNLPGYATLCTAQRIFEGKEEA